MSLKRVIGAVNLLAKKATTNLVFGNNTKALVASIAKQSLILTNNTKKLTSTILANAINAKAVLGKFFEFKELDDTASASESIDFDIDKVINITGRAGEQHSLNITRPLTDSIPRPTDLASLNPIKQPSDTSIATDSDPIFDVTKGIIELPVATEAISFDISYVLTDTVNATDDVNGAAIGDESNLRAFKVFTHNSSVAESHVLLPTKGLLNTASTADAGSIRAQDYVDNPLYFAEDYVGQSQSF